MPDPNMKRIFREAAELVKDLPRGLQEAAFHRALDVLLSGAGRDEEEQETDAAHRLFALPGSRTLLDTSVAAINMVADRLGIEELDADEVADFIEEKVGPHLNEGVVGRALDGADGVLRTLSGANPLNAFRHGPETADKTPPKARPKPKTKAAKPGTSKRETKKRQKDASNKAERTAAGGLAKLIVGLVKQGFFASARTTAQVVLHLNRQGFHFTVYQLAPVLVRLFETGLLRRTAAPGGQYAYEKA